MHESLAADLSIKPQKRALYAIAHDKLLELIQGGVLTPGTQLPSQDALASMLGVSRATAREAIRGLAQIGFLEQRQGVGTFVSPSVRWLKRGLEVLESLESVARRQQWVSGNKDLTITQVRAEKTLAEELRIRRGGLVNRIFRVKTANGKRIAHMTDNVPDSILPIDVLREQFKGSVLDMLLRRSDLEVEYASAMLSPVVGEADIADTLRIPAGTPLLLTHETLFTRDGRVVNVGDTYFLTGFFRFFFTRRLLRTSGD